jgi:hypothetical protein
VGPIPTMMAAHTREGRAASSSRHDTSPRAAPPARTHRQARSRRVGPTAVSARPPPNPTPARKARRPPLSSDGPDRPCPPPPHEWNPRTTRGTCASSRVSRGSRVGEGRRRNSVPCSLSALLDNNLRLKQR